MAFTVTNPKDSMYGAKAENVFCAFDGTQLCATACLYPFFGSPDIEFPFNVYFGIYSDDDDPSDETKNILLENIKERAKEIKLENAQQTAKLYTCLLSGDTEHIDYYVSKEFIHDAGMYILHKNLRNGTYTEHDLGNLKVQAWNMETTEEKLKFIETHKKHFRFHYTCEKIQELMKKPLWANFTVFHEDKILGNVMLFEESTEDRNKRMGWIEDLFVEREWRKKGIAKQLMVHAINYFKAHGVYEINLEVWSDNKNALSLYNSLGFEIKEETELSLGIYI